MLQGLSDLFQLYYVEMAIFTVICLFILLILYYIKQFITGLLGNMIGKVFNKVSSHVETKPVIGKPIRFIKWVFQDEK